MNLVYDMLYFPFNNIKSIHPQEKMNELGIKYEHSTPQSIGDCWWFWNCSNIPNPLDRKSVV